MVYSFINNRCQSVRQDITYQVQVRPTEIIPWNPRALVIANKLRRIECPKGGPYSFVVIMRLKFTHYCSQQLEGPEVVHIYMLAVRFYVYAQYRYIHVYSTTCRELNIHVGIHVHPLLTQAGRGEC